jgi:hypothetical protein
MSELTEQAYYLTGQNNFAFESAMGELTASYPPSEISSWERQRAEALAWEADNTEPTPWIDIAAAARNIERVSFLQRTVDKVTLFLQASAFLVGTRQLNEDAIKLATTVEELDAIAMDYTLPSAPP